MSLAEIPLPPEENAAINEKLAWGVEMLKEHRETHVQWRDWFRKHPDDPRINPLGHADFHDETVQRYDILIAVLEAAIDIPALVDEPANPTNEGDAPPASAETEGVPPDA